MPRISVHNGIINYSEDTILTNELKGWVKNNAVRDALIRYIKTNYSFYHEPHPSFNSFIYDDNGKLRPDIKNDAGMFGKKLANPKYEYEGGVIRYSPFLPTVNDVSERHLSDFGKLLYLLVAENDDNYECLKRYIAQYSFENKKSNRPTLILEGERGSGKNFLIEGILRKIWVMEYKKCPSNFAQFSSFTANKLVFFDEVRALGTTNVYDLIKNLSGSEFLSHNQKFMAEKTVEGKTHVVLSSNGKPIHIPYREIPKNPDENQFLCIHYSMHLSSTPGYRDLMNRRAVNGSLSDFIDFTLGAWLRYVALPIYKDEMLGKIRPRYGFRIPINTALRDLVKMSETDDDSNALHIFDHIYSISPMLVATARENMLDADICIRMLEEDHILTNDLILVLLKRMQFNKLTIKKFVKVGEKFKIIERRLKSNNRRGVLLNWRLLGRKMMEYDDDSIKPSAQQIADDDFDNMGEA